MSELKNKITTGLKWSAIERVVTQLIQLVVMLILGRMLGPKAFGLIGMLAIFISIAQTFVDSGFSNALIRKMDRDEHDYTTVFYFNIVMSIVCYAVLFISAPYISRFYNQPDLVILTRVLGLIVLVNSFSIVQRVRLSAAMDFKVQAKASLYSVFGSTILTFFLAYYKYGVWVLVFQTLSFNIINVILLNMFSPWFPRYSFSKKSFKQLFGFGSNLLISSLLDTIYNNIYQLVIGRFFSVNQLGLFSQAKNLSCIPAMTLTSVLQKVMYPMMSHIQDKQDVLEHTYLLTLRLSAVIIFPLIIGVGVIANPLFTLILGNEWVSAAELVSILCLGYMLYPIHAINLNLLQVKGRSDLFLKLEIIKKIITTAMLFVTVPFGVKAICIGMVIQSYLALLINAYYTSDFLSLSIIKQFKALSLIWMITIICMLIPGALSFMITNAFIKIVFVIFCSVIIYVLSIKYLQPDLFSHIIKFFLRK